ncbi:MAG: class I mannose-6-phosphate isomerase [Sphingosinicella sp.]|nr:class I mannose-6-phosphate isomerase [Sphingosinicella sp.]
MTVTRLETRRVEKIWGRRELLPTFGLVEENGEPVGEIWFEDPRGSDPELLVKYLFTSERLSIQVHPDDEAARRAGHPRGKDEAWVVLAAEPDATIGIGLRALASRAQLRAAALDGRIEQMIDWRPAKAGDVYYSPAGTIHALGPGLALVEVQQNVDLTYRLYDYGRPRELHLEEGIAVSEPEPYSASFEPFEIEGGRIILADGPAFVLERWTIPVRGQLNEARPLWLIPVEGGGTIDDERMEAGTAWLVEGPAQITIDEGSDFLIAYPGSGVSEHLPA